MAPSPCPDSSPPHSWRPLPALTHHHPTHGALSPRRTALAAKEKFLAFLCVVPCFAGKKEQILVFSTRLRRPVHLGPSPPQLRRHHPHCQRHHREHRLHSRNRLCLGSQSWLLANLPQCRHLPLLHDQRMFLFPAGQSCQSFVLLSELLSSVRFIRRILPQGGILCWSVVLGR